MNLKKETPYHGKILFGTETVQFSGNTILLRNISKFGLYNLKKNYQISNLLLLVAGVAFISGFFIKTYGFVIYIPATVVILIGIMERFGPNRLHGISIQLNSQSEFHFLSKDQHGVFQLFDTLTTRIEIRRPGNVIANFTDKSVTIIGDNNNNAGDNSSITNSQYGT